MTASEAPGIPAGSGRQRVLLVDDAEVSREIVSALLAGAGYGVDVAQDGAAALDKVQEHDFQLVLMDIEMPRMDGIEAARRIRSLGGSYERLPIVALTGNYRPDRWDAYCEARFDAHLGKPFRPATLLQLVADALGLGSEEGTGPEGSPGADAVHDNLAAIEMELGRPAFLEIVVHMLAKLEGQLSLLEAEPNSVSHAALERSTHVIMRTAGMLGLEDLCEECEALQLHIFAGAVPPEALAAVKRANLRSAEVLRGRL